MTQDAAREVESAQQLLDLLSFDSVDFYEIRARRRESVDSDVTLPPEPLVRVLHRFDEHSFEVRCAATVESPDASYFADAGARFVFSEPLTVPQEVATEFAERVGVMSVYPFIREAILDSSARLGAGRVLLGLMRPGRIRIVPEGEGQKLEPGNDTAPA